MSYTFKDFDAISSAMRDPRLTTHDFTASANAHWQQRMVSRRQIV